jgi:hypothetical protein
MLVNSSFVVGLILYCVCGLLCFLLCWFMAQYPRHCFTNNSNQQSIIRPKSHVAFLPYTKHCSKKLLSTLNPSTQRKYSIDVLKYRIGDDQSAIQKQRKFSPNDLSPDDRILQPRVLDEVFWQFHHPSSPVTSEMLLQPRPNSKNKIALYDKNPYFDCQKVYLTRTGSLANMPNKCLAVVLSNNFLSNQSLPFIPYYRRRGKVANNVDQYAKDFINTGALKSEVKLLPSFLQQVDNLVRDFIEVMGLDPILSVLDDGTILR